MQKAHIDGVYLILDFEMGVDSNVSHEFFTSNTSQKKDIISGFVNSIFDIHQWRWVTVYDFIGYTDYMVGLISPTTLLK